MTLNSHVWEVLKVRYGVSALIDFICAKPEDKEGPLYSKSLYGLTIAAIRTLGVTDKSATQPIVVF